MFLLGSPNTSELLASQPDRAKIATSSSESVSSNSFFSSGAASQTMSLENSSGYGSKTSTSSTSFDSIPNRSNTRGSSAIRNSFGSSSRESQISDSQQIKSQLPRRFSNEEKVNRPFIPPSRTQTPTSQAISFSQVNSNRNIFMKTRQDLLENTLRHMQIVSQSNQQNNRKNK